MRENEAWFYEDDGSVRAGTLNKLIQLLLQRDEKAGKARKHEIMICRDEVLKVSKIRRGDMERFTLKIDKKAIKKAAGKKIVISETKPGGAGEEGSAQDPDEKTTFYVWLEDKEEVTSAPEPTAEPTPEPEPEPYFPYWGGGSGVPHTRGSGNKLEYDHVELSGVNTNGEPMTKLKLGDEELEATLTTDTAPGGEGLFTAAVCSRSADGTEEASDDAEANTMILTAVTEEGQAQPGTYRWHINGAVFRRLGKSGIDTLILRSEDRLTLLPVSGFLAGREYDRLKGEGLAARYFDYEIVMEKPATDAGAEAEWNEEILVTVNGETVRLTEQEGEPIYATGVQSGPAERWPGLPEPDAATE